ncbi:MAG: 5-(carboxyamino)imidazole ribonucleotide mutase [Acidobacteria bacterium]|jgi:5-(carboxyamino)imidazole ribonucleotide mutase|nr:5-(carboxyamino)imidazole ribonucleotide mutase [Acidobacteriota bacterium]
MSSLDVLVLMGSASDRPFMDPAVALLAELGVAVRAHVTSAHRTPDRTRELVLRAETEGCSVFICAAGMAAHLAGAVAALTLRPVLGVPLPGGLLDGVDALLSTVQMPAGVPVATFAVGRAGAKNAAYCAAEIVALERDEVAQALRRHREIGRDKVLQADADLAAGGGKVEP